MWITLIALLLVNYIVGTALAPGNGRTNISYSFFRKQVEADNVADVESQSDTIQGTFREQSLYPASRQGKEVKRFQTVRPSLGDDGMLSLLLRKGVSVNAKPVQQGRPWWQMLLFDSAPRCCWWRCS